MRKIVLASHLNLAKGLNETLDFLMPGVVEITTITAYTQNIPIEEEIATVMADVSPTDEVLIFTDLLGGSVNQAFIPYLAHPHVHVITGVNLPILMTILLGLTDEYIDANFIKEAIKTGQKQLVYVNEYVQKQELDDEDE